MNWVDLVIIFILFSFILEGIRKSFISELLNLLSFLLAFILALRLFNLGAIFYNNYFQIPFSFANVLGFITIWFIVEMIFFLILHFTIPHIRKLQPLDQELSKFSFILSGMRGVIVIAIILVLFGTFPIQPVIKKEVLSSKIGSFMLSKTHQLETPLKGVFGGFTEETLSFFTIKPKSDETVDLGFKTLEFSPNQSLESQMIDLVNQERIKMGLKTLKFNQELREVGRVHSEDMFKRGYFSHYSPEGEDVSDRANKQGVSYFIIGENLAFAPDLNLAHQGLMNSEGHRANILSTEYSEIGIGIQDGGVYGLMITQVFRN